MRETSTAVVYVCPTGVHPSDHILELAVIRLDPQGRQEDVWQTMLRPARHALDIHPRGITYQDVKTPHPSSRSLTSWLNFLTVDSWSPAPSMSVCQFLWKASAASDKHFRTVPAGRSKWMSWNRR